MNKEKQSRHLEQTRHKVDGPVNNTVGKPLVKS